MRVRTNGRLLAVMAGMSFLLLVGGTWYERSFLPYFWNLLDADSRSVLTRTLFYVGGQPVRVWFLIKVLLFLVFLNLLSRLARFLIRKTTSKTPNFGEHRQYLLQRLVSFFIYAAGLLIGIQVERVNFSTLVILGGTLGVGIGFGLQSLTSNLIAGFILLVEQPIHIGDLIEFGTRSGEVVQIGTRSSRIKTSDNAVVVIPNSEFVAKEILNWTSSDPKVRVSVPVSVSHGSDVQQVIRVLLKLASEHPDVLQNPAPEVILVELRPSAIAFSIRVWTVKGANDFQRLRSDLYVRIVQQFGVEKIDLPLPQLDLHWKGEPSESPGLQEDTRHGVSRS